MSTKMKPLVVNLLVLCLAQFVLIECARRECVQKHILNADTVCVCNATYCDNFPALQKPKAGFASVYESNKSGARFKETELKIESSHKTSNSTKSQTVTIDENQKYQSIYGFGGAFTDTTGQMLKEVPESLAHSIIESYYSANGIEYSMGRIPIGGSDYSPRAYSYDDVDGDLKLTHFALQKEDLEWKIPNIVLAQKLSPHKIKLFGSPWSPPAWMKTNHRFDHSGSLRGEVGGEYYETWAHYFVKFLDAYKSHGIDMWGITVENEPGAGMNANYTFNCLNLTATQERDFVRNNLGPNLDKAGYSIDKLKLMIFDDGANSMSSWADTILTDKEAAKHVSGIAYHWYGNHRMSGFPADLLNQIHTKHPNYFVLNSEACHLEGAGNGRWDFAEHYAYDIMRALNNWVTGWVEWNMALDMNGGPRWNEKQGYGGPVYIDPKAKEAYKQPTFYAIGHFSKFIPPNSVRIGHKIDKIIDGLTVTTVRRPDNATVVIALNANKEEVEFNINDSKNHISYKIAPHSIQSYIWY